MVLNCEEALKIFYYLLSLYYLQERTFKYFAFNVFFKGHWILQTLCGGNFHILFLKTFLGELKDNIQGFFFKLVFFFKNV